MPVMVYVQAVMVPYNAFSALSKTALDSFVPFQHNPPGRTNRVNRLSSMRLSLRTLLAFEDNVFDVEQHRRLEQLLPTDQAAEATLQRIRSIVRNPMLGVPGLVDQQEELNPNYVAEYLDHQMPSGVQEKFEAYCLSADKYLAEVASIHHILSNVLGEPARTSRECRIKCYETLSAKPEKPINTIGDSGTAAALPELPKHFRPYLPQETALGTTPSGNTALGNAASGNTPSGKPASFWRRWFPSKPTPQPTITPVEQKGTSPLWTFCIFGLCIAGLCIGWQQIETKRAAQKLREMVETETVVSYDSTENAVADAAVFAAAFFTDDGNAAVGTIADRTADGTEHAFIEPHWDNGFDLIPSLPPSEPQTPFEYAAHSEHIEQVAHTREVLGHNAPPGHGLPGNELSNNIPITDPFPAVHDGSRDSSHDISAHFAAPSQAAGEGNRNNSREPWEPLPTTALPQLPATESAVPETLPPLADDTIIEFQPVDSASGGSVPHALPPPPGATWPLGDTPFLPEPVAVRHSLSETMPGRPLPQPPAQQPPVHQPIMQPPIPTQPITQTSGALPRVLGRALPMIQPNVMFFAESQEHPWLLPALPFDLSAGQYLLTAAPFRGTFELAGNFRIEMIGDAKLHILPPDASGVSGIFVDYGRIIIHPLQANQPLRIKMERAGGIVRTAGTESILFLDTFAEVSEPPSRTRLPEEQRARTSPILGFVPKNGEQIIWHAAGQPQPFYVNTQGSVLLRSDQYRFGEIKNLPNWLLGSMPMTQDDRQLAETCRRYFDEAGRTENDAGKIGAKALTWLVQDESQAVRILGLRLWGDLGEFFVPLSVAAEKQSGDEVVRRVLGRYFDEVMRRDAESIQRFSDAIEEVKEAQRRTGIVR